MNFNNRKRSSVVILSAAKDDTLLRSMTPCRSVESGIEPGVMLIGADESAVSTIMHFHKLKWVMAGGAR